jgi:tRNA nucleotidyltransferase (CCA-adding enzyme)
MCLFAPGLGSGERGRDGVKTNASSPRGSHNPAHRDAAQATILNLADRCRAQLSPALQALLQVAAQVADEMGLAVYAVGGFVRDLLLGVKNEDVDLTVEGDGIAFARHLAATIEGTCKRPSEFGTAVVLARDSHKIDVATARSETYKHPAALPTVQPGTIRDDLFRRDFTINTLAFALHGPQAFALLDWYGGYADLAEGVIRVLHNRSFRDDPTRIFRAVRLAQRFGFVLHPHTLRLLRRAVDKGWIASLSGARLWREVRLMLEGTSPVQCLLRLDEMGVLPQIDPALTLSQERLAVLIRVYEARVGLADTAPDALGRAWPSYLAALMQGLDVTVMRRLCARLALSPRVTQELIDGIAVVEDVSRWLYGDGNPRPSAVVAALRPLPADLVPLLLAWCPKRECQQLIRRYLTTWRHVRPCLGGDDLKRLGAPQGPQIGRLLARLQAAKLDGTAPTREAEEALVRAVLSAEA